MIGRGWADVVSSNIRLVKYVRYAEMVQNLPLLFFCSCITFYILLFLAALFGRFHWCSNVVWVVLPRAEHRQCQRWRKQRSREARHSQAWGGCPATASPGSSCLYLWSVDIDIFTIKEISLNYLEFCLLLVMVSELELFWLLKGSAYQHPWSIQKLWEIIINFKSNFDNHCFKIKVFTDPDMTMKQSNLFQVSWR